MILTVTLNPAVDMTITVDAVHLGETHRVDTARFRAGGKGLNVARVAHAQGEAVLALAPSGGASGAEMNTDDGPQMMRMSSLKKRINPKVANT